MSYHVAVTFALHQFFLTLPSCPVPNFIVYDQTSQVYFPQRLADRKDAEPAAEPTWRDADKEAVRKIFAALSQAATVASSEYQVIVLDHAAKSVWGGIPLVQEVDEWRNGQALIPAEWMSWNPTVELLKHPVHKDASVQTSRRLGEYEPLHISVPALNSNGLFHHALLRHAEVHSGE